MAKTRFINDRGLTARMTLVMFLLGAVFVALVVGLGFVFPGYAVLIGVIGLGVAWFQWYKSDTLALKAMRARVVTPEEAPELHGVIDRLCALADMPKPRVAIAYTDMPNAFATGRSANHSAVCVTTGIMDKLTAEEMEGVLAHELSHVAHRDVLVMTVAASAGIIAGMATRGAQYGAIFGGGGDRRGNDNNNGGIPVWLIVAGAEPGRVRRQLLPHPAALALPGAVRRPLGRLPDPEAVGPGQRADQDQRRGRLDPQQGPARGADAERLLHHPGDQRYVVPDPDLHAPVAGAAPGAARQGLRRARQADGRRLLRPRNLTRMGLWDTLTGRSKPVRANLDALFSLPSAAITLQTAAGFTPTGVGSVCYRAAEGAAFAQTQQDVVDLLDNDDDPDVERSTDAFGFTWLVARQDPDDLSALVTDLHTVNTSLEEQGFGPSLLCSLVGFRDVSGRTLGLVYLYKQGTFYPFAPQGPQRRDNLLEIQIRDLVKGDLPVEPQLSRWMPLWGAPGL